jgi:hypothetical protein
MEDSEGRLHWMLHHICAGLGVPMASLEGRLHVVSMRQVMHNGLAHFERDGDLEPRQLYYQAERLIEDSGAKFLALDNLAHLFLGNENDRLQATRFLSLTNKLASDTETAIALLAHTPKSGDPHSGSTAWVNAVRSHASIEKEDGGEPDVRVLKVSKGNYVRPGEVTRFRWFNHYLIRPDELPADAAAQLASTSRATAANDCFLKCLAAIDAQGRSVSHSGSSNYAPRQFAKMPEAKGFDEGDLEAAMERLLHLGTIKADEEVGKYSNRTARRGIKKMDDLAQSLHNRSDKLHNPAQSGAQSGAQSRTIAAQSAQSLHTQPLSPTGIDRGAPTGPPLSPKGLGEADDPLDDDWVPGDY